MSEKTLTRVNEALSGLFPRADVAMLANLTPAAQVEQICAAMWRLRGLRDAVDQLWEWSGPSATANNFVVRVERAFMVCAEALRELAPERRSIPVPDWKIRPAEKRSRAPRAENLRRR